MNIHKDKEGRKMEEAMKTVMSLLDIDTVDFLKSDFSKIIANPSFKYEESEKIDEN